MPPKKRALQESNANAQSKRQAKQQKSANGKNGAQKENPSDDDQSDHELDEELNQKKPDEYICIDRPFWDFESERRDNGKLDESKNIDAYNETVQPGKRMWPKPANAFQNWKWTTIQSAYRDPDNFAMYVYNDYLSYGLIDRLEKAIHNWHTIRGKNQNKPELSLPIMATLAHWMHGGFGHLDNMSMLASADDGERRTEAEVEVSRSATGHVIALEWSDGLDDIFEDNELEWREAIVGYAIRGGLDLEAEGCYGMKWTFNKYSDGGKVEDSKSKDRWALKEKINKYTSKHGLHDRRPLKGGSGFDITKWTRMERAGYSLGDNKDPLADVPVEVLKNDQIGFLACARPHRLRSWAKRHWY